MTKEMEQEILRALRTANTSWPLSEALVKIILAALGDKTSGIVSFRDPNFSAETGGFHPVEIMIGEGGQVLYITDFSYAGADLVKELDFDFACGNFQHMGREYPLAEGYELFKIWQANFTTYCRWGVFQMTVEDV